MLNDTQSRLSRASASLEGLSVGDALGERFFLHPDVALHLIAQRALPAPPWRYTDDTQMALGVMACLQRLGHIDQHYLAHILAETYDPSRGYGPAMHGHLANIRQGVPWLESANNLFAGSGSFGNGSSMRVAPLGAYFADDLNIVVQQAALSSHVTHTHPEAIAGAIAVAVAAALASQAAEQHTLPTPTDFLASILPHVPNSVVSEKIKHARDLPPGASIQLAVAALGNGAKVSAQDTVPYALWCAANHLSNFEDALWFTMQGLGDIDTNGAIVGGIVASYTGSTGIPNDWLTSREPLPRWSYAEPDPTTSTTTNAPIAPDSADSTPRNTVTLYRPVGPRELALIEESSFTAFPPRLPEQPIFYPVLNEEYAHKIARDWNVKQSGSGYVTRFHVNARFIGRYAVQRVGNALHEEYWIPAEDLPLFNANIVGPIEIIAEYK